MTTTFPQGADKAWKKSNSSDLYGDLVETKNITFDLAGYLALSYSPRATMNESIDADFDNVAAIIYDGSRYFAETWDEPFTINVDILANDFTQLTDTDHPNGSAFSDAVWFDSKLAVTENNDLHYYDAGTAAWVDTNVSLATTSNGQHPVKNFLSKSCLAVCNINTVLLYSALSATPTLLATLTIGTDFQITSAVYKNQNLYVGTRHKYGGDAALYVWNGEGTAAQAVHTVNASIIHDVCDFDESIVVFTSAGALERFNGSGFSFMAGFPIYYTERVLTNSSNIQIYHNCLKPNGDVLYISFSDSANSSAQMLNQPDGVWCYDPKVGLHHKYSFSLATTYKISDPVLSTVTDQITITRNIPTGTEVLYSAAISNSVLADDTKYYAIRVDATHVKLATTLANATAGTAIDFIADDGSTERFVFFVNSDYGTIYSDRPGAIQTIDYSQQNPEYGLDVIWAAEVFERNSLSASSSFSGSVTPGAESRGYFVTPKIFSQEVTDKFNLITLKFQPLLNESDKILIKYRTLDDGLTVIDFSNLKYLITWTSTTTFTSTDSMWASAAVGDEVNVLRGAAGGLMAHIVSVSAPVGGVYTITIDETFADYTAGDLSHAVYRNWIKWQTIDYGDENAEKGYLSAQLGKFGKYIQFKIELRGIGREVRIEEFMVDNVYKLSSKKSSQVVQLN